MKISIDIDCTPEEARRFFGLPDVAPMQEAVMAEVQERIMANLKAMDADTLIKTWMPAGMQGWEQMQKAFWSQMTGGAGGTKDKKE
jgi:hypothetical protein